MTCAICEEPTPATVCTICIRDTTLQARKAALLHTLLSDEAAGLAKKPASGWSTGGQTGAPAGVNIAAIDAQRELTAAVGDLAAAIGIGTTNPTTLADSLHRLAWRETDPTSLKELHHSLGIAVRTAERMVDTPPEIILHGSCPACRVWVRAPRDRVEHTCTSCGAACHLPSLREVRGEIIHDRLDGMYFTASNLAAALTLVGYPASARQVNNWGARGKIEVRSDKGRAVYSFDDALDVAERAHIKKNTRVA